MPDKNDSSYMMRHSLAHIMATAIQHLWPQAKFGIGPVVDNGFYYDIDFGGLKISEDDLPKIEAEMRKIISLNLPFEHFDKSIDDALAWAHDNGQVYKEELLNDLKRDGTTLASNLNVDMLGLQVNGDSKVETVSFYKDDDFIDLCRGPHVESTGKVGAFKLVKLSGAYWRGQSSKPQMVRIYGLAFDTEGELDSYLGAQDEARLRDHKRLGQQLDLFVFSDLVGAGLPLFTPRGTVLRDALLGFSEELQIKNGFQKVAIPHITKRELYEKSGHWDKFGDELFLVKSQETKDQFVLKPMNCPHHIQIYASRPRSYKELPVRYMESTIQYRDEKKGELNGLSRVRAISIDDAHIFCTLDQIEVEFTNIMNMIKEMYMVFGMQFKARLSFRNNTGSYLGSTDMWDKAQEIIEAVAQKLNVEYFIAEGEAAFYGPKIDVMVTDALGREWQCATEQLDFVQPERFGLRYIDTDGSEKQPVMIHKALLGSFERFLAVYIEHTAGKFPVWSAPEQVRLVTVNQEKDIVDFAEQILNNSRNFNLRFTIDDSNETVGKKIREAEMMKVPYIVVIGSKEIATGEIIPRIRKDIEVSEQHTPKTIEEFLKTVANEAKSRTTKTSL